MLEKELLYILDTNVLIEDPEVIFRFPKARLGIPIFVLEELDKIKIESSSRGARAQILPTSRVSRDMNVIVAYKSKLN